MTTPRDALQRLIWLGQLLFSRDVETSRRAEINLYGGGMAKPPVRPTPPTKEKKP